MLIAISGSQGSGKTTLLSEIKQQEYIVTERKTSRSILEEWGYTLEQVTNNFDLLIKFQEEILNRKYFDELMTIKNNPNKIIFTERTFADVFIYAAFSGGKDNANSDWIDDYFKRCLRYNQIYDMVYYLSGGYFMVKNDGVRGINAHYSKMIDMCMKQYTIDMTHPSKLNIINNPNLIERVELILNQVSYKEQNK